MDDSGFPQDLVWVAVDTETTGLNPWKHELLEIGAARFTLQGIQEEFQVLIRPEHKIDPRSRAIHNISNEEIEEHGKELGESLEAFFRFVGSDPLVFHNAPFDASFIHLAASKSGLAVPAVSYYDNLYLSRSHFPSRKSHSLEVLRKDLKIESGPAHRALSDAVATAEVFLWSFQEKPEVLSSRKKLNQFLRYHRRFDSFVVKLPKNLDEIMRYFERKIKEGAFLKIQYYNKDQKSFTSGTFVPMEVMVFNQRVFIKAKGALSTSTTLIPLKGAIIHDQQLGALKLVTQ